MAANEDRIGKRVYEIWEQERRPLGEDMQYWPQASRKLPQAPRRMAARSRTAGQRSVARRAETAREVRACRQSQRRRSDRSDDHAIAVGCEDHHRRHQTLRKTLASGLGMGRNGARSTAPRWNRLSKEFGSERPDVFGLRLAGLSILTDVEGYVLAFLQDIAVFQGRYVDEHVGTARFRRDEAKTLVRVEKLYFTGRHETLVCLQLIARAI